MDYSIVFSSKTGNTELIAKRIRKLMGDAACVYFGSAKDAPEAARKAGVVFVGTWTDKGSATDDVTAFIHSFDGARVFLFGTCGYGQDEAYFNTILSRIREGLATNCEVIGSFMCQGKIAEAALERYHTMLAAAEPASPEAKRAQLFIKNFEEARSHPNNDDLRALEASLRAAGLI